LAFVDLWAALDSDLEGRAAGVSVPFAGDARPSNFCLER
jgi:hypothetical protein